MHYTWTHVNILGVVLRTSSLCQCDGVSAGSVEICFVDRMLNLVDWEWCEDLDIPIGLSATIGRTQTGHSLAYLAPSGSTILSSTTSAARSLYPVKNGTLNTFFPATSLFKASCKGTSYPMTNE